LQISSTRTNTNKTALDVDTSVTPLILDNVWYQTGTTKSLGGLKPVFTTAVGGAGGSTAPYVIYDTVAKIGIGTTTPWARLSVAGDAGGTMPLFTISTSTAGAATSTALIVDSNGKVGDRDSDPRGGHRADAIFHRRAERRSDIHCHSHTTVSEVRAVTILR
jgi:hypothetical protein